MGQRTLDEFVRIYGPVPYRAWGYRLPCVKVGCKTRDFRPGTRKLIECCHTGTDGVSRKADWDGNTYFACWRCHLEQGNEGLDTFAARHRLEVDGIPVSTLRGAAHITHTLFLVYDGGLAE